MGKIQLIIAREYLTRVKKLSFVIMTLLGPILMAALFIVPVYMTNKSQKQVKLVVVDENHYFINSFHDSKNAQFTYRSGNVDQIKREALGSGEYDAVLHILESYSGIRSNLYYYKEPPMNLRSNIENQLDKLLFDKVLQDTFQINPKKFEQIKSGTKSHVSMIQTDEHGNTKKHFAGLNRLIGIVLGFAIYIFIFMYSSQVLRSVLEEKTNRIVEVLLSSIKPIQLMFGKIVGVALVGLTQFLLWVIFTAFIIGVAMFAKPDLFTSQIPQSDIPAAMVTPGMDNDLEIFALMQEGQGFGEILETFYGISFSEIILLFLFYFIFGYLLYAALFASIGSAVDNEADSNQFTMPVTIPLILTLVMIMPIADDPNSSLAWWFSMIPFTSPVGMLVRLPSGVPLPELILSMGLMIATFVLCLWFAAKVYKTGILMYGKKITYKDLWKWLKY
ncbi:ABC transporter permease [Bacteroidales bacterium OttesenSCG-928-B11]|nr:ABC transporter permease [Bacteroidales bacterium OttesenSCG-928-E04]MDL2313101.1 ABC transporter permease [Bacteroidales bacterium OttesenSCG-928-B11]MDL2326562.1 ABC transporter permease [Bacteroidales bacterium OttesenSCG-928-A14]